MLTPLLSSVAQRDLVKADWSVSLDSTINSYSSAGTQKSFVTAGSSPATLFRSVQVRRHLNERAISEFYPCEDEILRRRNRLDSASIARTDTVDV